VEVAQRIGLVHWVAPAGSLDALVEQKVGDVLSSGPEAAREAKRLIREVVDLEREPARELTAARIAALRSGEEGQEGLRAFLDKRQPRWKTSR
jgi:methylglutaconyl-CoA hydratase